MKGNREYDFIIKIDCKFPYNNPRQAFRLIEEALTISDQAIFTVMEELCRLPYSQRRNGMTRRRAWKYLEYLTGRFEHPAKNILASVAKEILKKEMLTIEQVKAKTNELRPYKIYPGLSILYEACDDVTGEVEDLHKLVCKEWNKT